MHLGNVQGKGRNTQFDPASVNTNVPQSHVRALDFPGEGARNGLFGIGTKPEEYPLTEQLSSPLFCRVNSKKMFPGHTSETINSTMREAHGMPIGKGIPVRNQWRGRAWTISTEQETRRRQIFGPFYEGSFASYLSSSLSLGATAILSVGSHWTRRTVNDEPELRPSGRFRSRPRPFTEVPF